MPRLLSPRMLHRLRKPALSVALAAFGMLVIAACGNDLGATPSTGTSTVPPAETPQTTVEASTPTEAPAPSTPTMAPVEGKVDARVTAFELWQDYMPIVPRDGAPLYGVVTVEITHTEKVTPQIAKGAVTLTQASGATVAADLPATMQQQADDLGMLTPGPQSVTFTFGPATPPITLVEGEMIGGRLALTVAGEGVELALPPVALYFTH